MDTIKNTISIFKDEYNRLKVELNKSHVMVDVVAIVSTLRVIEKSIDELEKTLERYYGKSWKIL